MDIYLVRHGQTAGNLAHRHQHPNTPLTTAGEAQAVDAAIVLTEKQPTHLITSTHTRAVETARIIGQTCGLIPETYPAFEELHRPRNMVGSRMLGWSTIKYVVRWFYDDTSASMHDGETYESFLSRLATARTHLEELPADARVIVVSHSVYINFFIAHCRHPRRMGLLRAFITFAKILLLKNSSITHLRFTGGVGQAGGHWKVVHH